jgi:hypothetical protein
MNKHKHGHKPFKQHKKSWEAKDPSIVSAPIQDALRKAMVLEGVPVTSFDDFLWIMAQESSGVVDARNPDSTARGLYQLLRPQYELNPHGERSFGNAIEECQSGIHYIMGRYHTASLARAFWEKHHWY